MRSLLSTRIIIPTGFSGFQKSVLNGAYSQGSLEKFVSGRPTFWGGTEQKFYAYWCEQEKYS